jgi:hypothetical protein
MESPTKNKNKIPKTQNEREKNTQKHTQRRRNSSISQEVLADDFQGAAARHKRLATRFLSTAAPIHALLLLRLLLLLSLCITVIELFFEKRRKKRKLTEEEEEEEEEERKEGRNCGASSSSWARASAMGRPRGDAATQKRARN